MSHISANKECYREFVQLYLLLPELWEVKSNVYKHSNLKAAERYEVVEKLREIEEVA
jgi:hypothetical protein